MKKIITLGVFFSLFILSQSFGQAVGASDCNSVRVIDPGVNTNPRTKVGPLLYLKTINFSRNICAYVVAAAQSDVVDVSSRQFTLYQVRNPNDPVPSQNLDYITYNFTGIFENLDVGTYLIDVFDAQEETGSCFNP